MALIFCEGFEDSRYVNSTYVSHLPDVWEFVSGSGHSFSNSNGRSGAAAARLNTSSATTSKLKFKLDTFGAQSGKTLYVGFGVEFLQSAPGEQGTTLPTRLVTFFDAAGDEVLQVSVKKETSTDTTMHLVIGQTGTVFADYSLSDLSFNTTTESAQPYIYNSSWVYLEFKINLVDGIFTLRANGIPKFVVATSSAESTYSTPISEISAIQFHGNLNNSANYDVKIDDFYLADNTGDSLNSWIGPCRVLLPQFTYANFDSNEVWDYAKISSWTSDLAANDGDTSFVSSGTVDKKQLVGLITSNVNLGSGSIAVSEDEYIAAVQLSTVLRKTNLNGAVKPIYKSAASTYHDLGTPVTIDTDNYKSQIFIADKNPATNTNWNLTEVTTAYSASNIGFGLQIVDPATL